MALATHRKRLQIISEPKSTAAAMQVDRWGLPSGPVPSSIRSVSGRCTFFECVARSRARRVTVFAKGGGSYRQAWTLLWVVGPCVISAETRENERVEPGRREAKVGGAKG